MFYSFFLRVSCMISASCEKNKRNISDDIHVALTVKRRLLLVEQ